MAASVAMSIYFGVRMRHLSPLLLALILFAAPVFADSTPPAPPEPERYVDEGQYSQYAKVAQDFLQTQGDSPSAPRVAVDLLVTASVFNDQASALKSSKLLIGNYPTSVQTRFLVSLLL